jgi:hypothetical protein
MAKTKLVFLGTERSETNGMELEAYCTVNDEIYISITDNTLHIPEFNEIFLDRLTAIKLVKNLKQEIAKMEVDNG